MSRTFDPYLFDPYLFDTVTERPLAHWKIEMEFAGSLGFIDVTQDVRSEFDIELSYGIRGITATDRVASTGTLQFTMNNGPTNSAHLVGYYSPDNANVRPGFNYGIRVRLVLTYVPVGTVYKFLGTLDVIKPTAGVRGRYLTHCVAVDWMDEAARFHVSSTATQVNKRGDQVFRSVISSVPVQPAAIETSTGLDTYPYALDNVQDEKTTVLQIFQALALSELGYIYIKGDVSQGGTLVYESRSVRGSIANTPVQTFSNTMEFVQPERSRTNLLNKVQVTAHPRQVDTAATTVLYTLDSATLVQAFTSIALTAPYRDQRNRFVRVGAANMTAPVANTDYKANSAADGTGTNLTGSFSVTGTFTSGNSAALLVANNGGVDGYIGGNTTGAFLQLRGQGVYDYNTAVAVAQDTDSQNRSGQRVINVDMPYQANPAVAVDAASYILNIWSSPNSYVPQFRILGNWTDDLMRAVMQREISDPIALDETITGVKSTTKYFINGIDIVIEQGRIFRATYILAPADQNAYWILEKVGQSELGQTTRLGYGLIVGHGDIPHSDVHFDSGHIDSAHTDSHGDVTHVDVAHGDASHQDDAHQDSAHADISHGDSHGDVAHVDSHSDTAHNDVAHGDSTSHSDSHDDVAHGDTHSDVPHIDQHQDFDVHDHLDNHGDQAHVDVHDDVPHSDDHQDAASHTDSHGDLGHSDSHTDTVHNDQHQDITHTDSAHVDVAHGDGGHADSAHQDTAHTDSHVDVAHGDADHVDSHGDVTHTDA